MEKHHLKRNSRLSTFMEEVNQCKGSVRYVTDRGDDLDLKSEFAGVIFASTAVGSKVPDGWIVLDNPEDAALLSEWLV